MSASDRPVIGNDSNGGSQGTGYGESGSCKWTVMTARLHLVMRDHFSSIPRISSPDSPRAVLTICAVCALWRLWRLSSVFCPGVTEMAAITGPSSWLSSQALLLGSRVRLRCHKPPPRPHWTGSTPTKSCTDTARMSLPPLTRMSSRFKAGRTCHCCKAPKRRSAVSSLSQTPAFPSTSHHHQQASVNYYVP